MLRKTVRIIAYVAVGAAALVGLIGPRATQAAEKTTEPAVKLVIDNLTLQAESAELEFGLTPGEDMVTVPVESKNGASVQAVLDVMDRPEATGWVLRAKEPEGKLLVELGGAFPPAPGSSYTRMSIPDPARVSSPDAARAIGRIEFTQFGVRFFFRATPPAVIPNAAYSGKVKFDTDDDDLLDREEEFAVQVAKEGNALVGIKELRIRQTRARYEVTVKGEGAEIMRMAGIWDFQRPGPVTVDEFPVMPVLIGFQPVEGKGTYELQNVFPSLDELFKVFNQLGVPWVLISGPQAEAASAGDTPATDATRATGGTLVVTVTRDPQGTAIEGADVQITRDGRLEFERESDPSGTVQVGLAAGSLQVKVVAPNMVDQTLQTQIAAGETTRLSVRMKPLVEKPSDVARQGIRRWMPRVAIGAAAFGGLAMLGLGYAELRRRRT